MVWLCLLKIQSANISEYKTNIYIYSQQKGHIDL